MGSARRERLVPFSRFNRPVALASLLGLAVAVLLMLMLDQEPANATISQVETQAASKTSMQLDSAGNPVISYMLRTSGVSRLGVIHCNDVECSGGDETTAIPDAMTGAGSASSLALDASGNPVIAHVRCCPNVLRIVHCADPACASATVAAIGGHDIVETSLQLDSAGRPVIAAWDIVDGNLLLVHCGDANCTSANNVSVADTHGGSGFGSTGRTPSLALDGVGNPVIGYSDEYNTKINLMHCNDPNCAGGNESIEVLDTGGNRGVSVALDTNGFPVVAYTFATALKVAHCNDVNCAGGNESIVSPDPGAGARYPSLRLDAAGAPVIAAYDPVNLPVTGDEGELRVIRCGNANCSSGNVSSAPDTLGGGWGPSLALDTAGRPVVTYHDIIWQGSPDYGDVNVLHCSDATCSNPSATLPPPVTPSPSPTPFAGNTPPSVSPVVVPLNGGQLSPVGATVTFNFVSVGGVTSLDAVTELPLPPNFKVVGPPEVFYEIHTTATWFGVTVCIGYDPDDITGSESGIQLMHYTGGVWQDLHGAVNTTENYVCGSATSFSVFALVEPDPPVGGTVDVLTAPPQDGPGLVPWAIAALLALTFVSISGVFLRRRMLP